MNTKLTNLHIAHTDALNKWIVAAQSCDLAYRIKSYEEYLIARNAYNQARLEEIDAEIARKYSITIHRNKVVKVQAK